MSLLLKKSISSLSRKDIDKELQKIEEFEQDIECSICQCTYTSPVMVDSCMHLYCEEWIKAWSKKVNECPKCKETIKGYNKQENIETLVEFYLKLCSQEKGKLLKIKELINQREEMQSTINSMLDSQIQKPIRPSTAKPTASKKMEFDPHAEKSNNDSYFDNTDSINCKICLRRPLSKPLNEYEIMELSPISLNGNPFLQNALMCYLSNSKNMNLNGAYQNILNELGVTNGKKIYPEWVNNSLKKTDSACEECLFEFSEGCLYYYCLQRKHEIVPEGKEDWEMGVFCYQQAVMEHAEEYNHLLPKF